MEEGLAIFEDYQIRRVYDEESETWYFSVVEIVQALTQQSDYQTASHKKLKGLKTQNLRDHMSEAELIFTALAELSTRQITQSVDATGMDENKVASKKGGAFCERLVQHNNDIG